MKKIALIFLFITSLVYSKSYVLITTLYNETHQERAEEYIICLKNNLNHPLIEKIHVLYDTAKDANEGMHILDFLKENNIEMTYINGRATYQQCFDIANTKYPEKHILLSNGDIYFNNTLYELDEYDVTNKFLVLTRWEVNKDGSLSKQYGTNGKPLTCSQDAWIFDTPIRLFSSADIKLGILGCDCAIAKQARLAGLEVLNPCLTIQCCHVHRSNVRHYPHHGYPDFVETEWTYLKAYK